MNTTFSWRWKLIAVAAGVLIGASSVLALRQGQEDNQAEVALKQAKAAAETSLENDKRIEAARMERVRQINHVNLVQCRSLRNLYAIIRRTIEQSDRDIDQIVYYHDHPDERLRAHLRNAETLLQFKQPSCPADITLPNKPIVTKP